MASRKWYKVLLLFTLAALITLVVAAQLKMEDTMWPWEISSVEEAALSGDSSAVKKLYYHYSSLPSGKDEANRWLRKGAELGMEEVQYMYASVLKATAPEESICWYGRAGVRGHFSSMYRVAMYFREIGEVEEYKKWLAASASKGYIPAELDLADLMVFSEAASLKDKQYAYFLYSNTLEKSKEGSVSNRRAKEGVERLGSEVGEIYLDEMVFDESAISREMRLSIDDVCTRAIGRSSDNDW